MEVDQEDITAADITEKEDHQEWLEEFWDLSHEEQAQFLRELSMKVGEEALSPINGPVMVQYGLGTWDEDGSFVTIGGANCDGYWNGRLLADAIITSLQEGGEDSRIFDGLVDGLLTMQHISLPVALALTERAQPRNGEEGASPSREENS